jgi:hydrogenase large subunit
MVSSLSGKIPHSVGIVPGGVTSQPSTDTVLSFLWKLRRLQEFVNNVYIPDVIAVAGAYLDYASIGAGCQNLLSYGAYDLESANPDYTRRKRLFKQGTVSADLKYEPLDASKITEHVRHSWYEDSISKLHPSQGDTKPKYDKDGAYSWLKAPRYDSQVYEVGPLARLAVTYASGDPAVRNLVDGALARLNAPASALFSVLGRHLARALCAKLLAENVEKWLFELKPGTPAFVPYEIPAESTGMGLTEGARGALGHWIQIKDKKIANYQCVVPTTWNGSPRDDNGVPGAIEQALIGTKIRDEKNPFEIVRIIRSFDPCIACAVHVLKPEGKELVRLEVVRG